MKTCICLLFISFILIGKPIKCFGLTNTNLHPETIVLIASDSNLKITDNLQNTKDSVAINKFTGKKIANNGKIIGDMVMVSASIYGLVRGRKAARYFGLEGLDLAGFSLLGSGIYFAISFTGVKLVTAITKSKKR